MDDFGARIAGIEIDHDSGTDRLDDYASWLKELRSRLPKSVTLSITALPDWSRSPSLRRLLASVDAVTVQVYSPASIDGPLFDAAAARATLAAFIRAAGRTAVRLSLPAYRVGVGVDENVRAPALEFETPSGRRREQHYELVAAPNEVGAFASAVRDGEVVGMGGIVWFRLPQATDRHSFTKGTFHALLRGQPIVGDIRTELVPIPGRPGTFDIALRNNGPHDGIANRAIDCPASCNVGDAMPGWRVEATRFVPISRDGFLIRSGEVQRVGWLRCAKLSATPVISVAIVVPRSSA